MGWFDRLFPGNKKPATTAAAPTTTAGAPAAPAAAGVPPEKAGLDGEFDDSGLAKRVALAFDKDPLLDDVGTLWVAQLSSKVVLKGKVPSDDYLKKAVAIAGGVSGATEVDSSQVTID